MRNRKTGFTLVEIMIVVLIIGILLAIAVPNFINARTTSRQQTVLGNLKQVDTAMEQWAMDKGKKAGDAVVQADLEPDYVKKWPTGPLDAAVKYEVASVGTPPTYDGKDATWWSDRAQAKTKL